MFENFSHKNVFKHVPCLFFLVQNDRLLHTTCGAPNYVALEHGSTDTSAWGRHGSPAWTQHGLEQRVGKAMGARHGGSVLGGGERAARQHALGRA